MLELASKVEQSLQQYESGHARDLLMSEAWLQVRGGVKHLTTELEIKGKNLSAGRVDREYTQLTEALRYAVKQDNPPKIKDDFMLWDISQEFLCTLRGLSHFQADINRQFHTSNPQAVGDIQVSTEPIAEAISTSIEKLGQAFKSPTEPKKTPTPSKSKEVPKRSWTATALNEAIREYQAKRASTIDEYSNILKNANASFRQKKHIRQKARELFGRNAIARALGVKSPRMVGESSAWKSLSKILQLSRKSNDPTLQSQQHNDYSDMPSTDSTPRSAAKPYGADEKAISPDILDMQEERKQTLKYLRKLHNSGDPDMQSQAKAMAVSYENGEMTDEQVRQTVDLLLDNC